LKRANEYTKENIDVIYRFQIDFERKFGTVEGLEKAEEKMTSFLLKKEEEAGLMKAPKGKGELKAKWENKKRKHEEMENNGKDEEEPNLKKKQKTQKKEGPQQFKDTKYLIILKKN